MDSCIHTLEWVPPIAVPAGNYNGSFNNVGSNANFWTSTENSSTNAYNRNFSTGTSMDSNNNNKNNGNSVRLVKDSSAAVLDTAALFSLLYNSYMEARRNKRNTASQLKFERCLERNLLDLATELFNRTYKPSPSVCFINEKPVKREVIAADFRDRVVHHLLCRWLFPVFERQFIHDSYSCRKHKGTLFGINRVRGFVRSASKDFSVPCYVLRLDISGFFMNIDRNILYRLIMDGLERDGWRGVPDRRLCMFLVQTIVFQNPLDNAVFRSPRSAWDGLPRNKSLMNTEPNKGLPIGNLTSQLFGNIYLNSMDQYIKRGIKIRHYGRYVDDMVLVHTDKDRLLGSIGRIRSFLRTRLSLELHPHKVHLQDATKGFSFLGAYILPYHVYPSKRLRKSFNHALLECKDSNECISKLVSYTGLFSHYNGMLQQILG